MSVSGLKAISVRQPWAWALIHAGKDVENRSEPALRHMSLRLGHRIAIHAAKGMTREEYEDAAAFMRIMIGVACPAAADLVRGAVIGSVTAVGIVKVHSSPWFFGPRAIVVADPRPCAPIAAVGERGLFNWTPGGELGTPAKWMLPAPGAAVIPKEPDQEALPL